MLLQTLIENAVKHGVSQTRGPGRIEVIVRSDAAAVVVEVRDNGPGPGAAPTMPRSGTDTRRSIWISDVARYSLGVIRYWTTAKPMASPATIATRRQRASTISR